MYGPIKYIIDTNLEKKIDYKRQEKLVLAFLGEKYFDIIIFNVGHISSDYTRISSYHKSYYQDKSVVKITEYGDVPNGVFVGTFWNNHFELDNDIGKFAKQLLY